MTLWLHSSTGEINPEKLSAVVNVTEGGVIIGKAEIPMTEFILVTDEAKISHHASSLPHASTLPGPRS